MHLSSAAVVNNSNETTKVPAIYRTFDLDFTWLCKTKENIFLKQLAVYMKGHRQDGFTTVKQN